MKKALLIIYVLALHILVALLLFKPQLVDEQRWRLGLNEPEPSVFATETHRMFKAIDDAAPDGAIILIGDSHFQRMPADLLPANALNLGIGGDTVRHMAKRAADYRSTGGAQAVFVWGGYNDLLRRKPEAIDQDMKRLMEALPDDKSVYLLGLVPVGKQNVHGIGNAVIETLNERYAKRCFKPCRFISISAPLSEMSGTLNPQYDSGDGIHLNRTGNAVVAEMIKARLNSAPNHLSAGD